MSLPHDSLSELPDIPEQRVPTTPEVLAEGTNLPNLGYDLEYFQWADRFNELEVKEHKLTVERSMLWQRKVYAFLLFLLSAGWLLFISVFLWHAGKHKLIVADSVLIALITTTTINVLGLFYIVARWLFPHKPIEEVIKETRLIDASIDAALKSLPKK